MLFLKLLGFEIKIVDLVVPRFARLPVTRKGSFETFFGNVIELLIISGVHAQVLGVLFDFLKSWLVV
jgi:hypothetical protein